MSDADPDFATYLRTGWFVTCDPGVQYPAVAIFDRGTLTHASRVKLPATKLREFEEGERVRQIVRLCWEHVKDRAPLRGRNPNALVSSVNPREMPLAVVHEWPQAYTGGKSKNSATQLFPLAAIGAGLAIKFDVPAVSPEPARWIGQVPKDDRNPDCWDSPRGRMIRRRLQEREISAIVPSHDAVDSVGIGLHVLGRLDKTYAGTV